MKHLRTTKDIVASQELLYMSAAICNRLCISLSVSLSLSFTLSLSLSHTLSLSLSPMVGDKIVDKIFFQVTPDTPLTQNLKGYGFKFKASANSLNHNVTSLSLSLHTGITSHFNIPENMELVSGIYWVDIKGEIANPITIEIEHCASPDQPSQFSSLSFASTEPPAQGAGSYQLQPFPGGGFPLNSSYGSIQLSQSSGIAIVTSRSVSKYCRALKFYMYMPKPTTTWILDLIIIYDLEISIKVCN